MCQRGWEVRPCGLALDRSPAWALAQSRLIPMWLCLGFLWVPLFPAIGGRVGGGQERTLGRSYPEDHFPPPFDFLVTLLKGFIGCL